MQRRPPAAVYNLPIDTCAELQRGLPRPDKNGRNIAYRHILPGDDIDTITDMLHEAYARLAAHGMRLI